jgi:2EXR family
MPKQVIGFSIFPTEIRLHIWRYGCLTPRLIEIRTDDYPGNWNIPFYPTRHGTKIRTIQWITQTPAPAVLSVCHESREMALKIYTLRFEVLASGSYTIYINPLVDTIYGNFKWVTEFLGILINDMKAFDEEDIGIRNLALPLHYGSITWTQLPMDMLGSVTLIIEGSLEPYWQDWNADTVLIAPVTELEVRRWEKEGRKVSVTFDEATRHREKAPVLNISAIRRGDSARALSAEDGDIPVLYGPRRPHIDHDAVPPGVAVWDRYDL